MSAIAVSFDCLAHREFTGNTVAPVSAKRHCHGAKDWDTLNHPSGSEISATRWEKLCISTTAYNECLTLNSMSHLPQRLRRHPHGRARWFG